MPPVLCSYCCWPNMSPLPQEKIKKREQDCYLLFYRLVLICRIALVELFNVNIILGNNILGNFILGDIFLHRVGSLDNLFLNLFDFILIPPQNPENWLLKLF